ncbi:MAG: endonuclease VII domain-containing protein [Rubrobacteraceae bacterium]
MSEANSTKRCSRCKESKDGSEFSLARRSRDELQPWCKVCYAVYKTDSGYSKSLQELHKVKHNDTFYQLAYSEQRSKRCPECGQTKSVKEFYRQRSSSGRFAAYCKPCDVQKTGRSARKRKYGVAVAEYDDLLLKQDGRCAICKRLPYTKKGLVVDHCHQTGAIRGILCSRCNSALGMLDDSPALLERALEYLTQVAPYRH